MFEITKTEIKNLSDQDLRILIGLLCEATLSKHGINSKSVYYGGNQDAKDGGVDVLVKSTNSFDFEDYISNPNTIIQVKVPNMTYRKILEEIKPNGKIREIFTYLRENNGEYIIASSRSDVTYREQILRENAIGCSLVDIDPESKISFAFYDCNKIVSWVNEYPSLCIWVQNRTGLNVTGWLSFVEWSNSDTSFKKEWVFDEKSCLYRDSYNDADKLDIVSALSEIRILLSKPSTIVRLAGLSGVGKTRFAFSLFSNNEGDNFQDANILIYCDMSNNPTPEPITMIQYLLKLNKRIILVVDNCEKNMHTVLSDLCKSPNSLVSLLTIEFDAKEDDLVDTTNYYMSVSSDHTIEMFIKSNFGNINAANLETLISMSGGNFRMAKYLASNINESQTIGVLNSSQILNRLFMNQNILNVPLSRTAEACSLLFSFNIENELGILSNISGISPRDVYENVNLLVDMKLIQVRRNMRAVLPHALANALAIKCLKANRSDEVVKVFLHNRRTLLSFSRRLKFLHSSTEAKNTSKEIINKSGYFDDFENIDSSYIEIIYNLTFVIPDVIKDRIGTITNPEFFSRKNENYNTFVNILIFLGYDDVGFSDVISMLLRFACSEGKNENTYSIRDRVENLFHLFLSGTYATVEQRLKAVEEIVVSDDSNRTDFGLHLVNEMLKTSSFYGYNFDFGAMKRDYGYQPKTYGDQLTWYQKVLDYCQSKIENNYLRGDFKQTISNNFTGLTELGMLGHLENIINNVITTETWPEIWISVLETLHFGGKDIPESIRLRLKCLAEQTKPNNLIDEFNVYISNSRRVYISEDDLDINERHIDEKAFSIGQQFAKDFTLFQRHLSMLLESDNYRMIYFGRGLVCSDIPFDLLFNTVFEYISNSDYTNTPMLLKGMISGKIDDKKTVKEAMQMVLSSDKTKRMFPDLLSSVRIDCDIIQLIKTGLVGDSTSLKQFKNLAYTLVDLTIEEMIDIFQFVPNTNEGIELQISIISVSISKAKFDDRLMDLSADSISRYRFDSRFSKNTHINYEFSIVSKATFGSNKYEVQARKIFEKLYSCLKVEYISFSDLNQVFEPIIRNYPIEFLDIFIRYDTENSGHFLNDFLTGFYGFHQGPLSFIDDEILVKWVQTNNSYELLLKYVLPFNDIDKGKCSWTNLGLLYISKAENTSNLEIIKNLIDRIYPRSWDQTLPDVLTSRIPLVQYIVESRNSKIHEYAINLLSQLHARISHEREHFSERNKEEFNLFETS